MKPILAAVAASMLLVASPLFADEAKPAAKDTKATTKTDSKPVAETKADAKTAEAKPADAKPSDAKPVSDVKPAKKPNKKTEKKTETTPAAAATPTPAPATTPAK
jgi:hypothetical protein